MQDVALREVPSLRIARASNALGGLREIVGRVPELEAEPSTSQSAPVFPKGIPTLPAFTTRKLPDRPVELHVGVPADDHVRAAIAIELPQPFLRRGRVKISVSLRGVAWQNSTSPNPAIQSERDRPAR